MNHESMENGMNRLPIRCHDREEQIVMLACGELEPEAAAQLDAHLLECEGCAEAFEEEKLLHEAYLLNAGEEPSPALLAECRAQLEEAVDRASLPGFWVRVWAGFSKSGWTVGYRNWLTAHPVMGALAFILIGIVAGNVAPRWYQQATTPSGFQSSGAPLMVRGNDVDSFGVRSISVDPTGVVVSGVREIPLNFHGTADDPMIRRVLLGILPNGDEFNVDTRMMALELLRERTGEDQQVRDLLCQTARNDRDPAVRLKALESLRGLQRDEAVRKTLTQVLLHDNNPGVRIEAINSLQELARMENVEMDRQTVDVLRDRMEKDPSTYIRMQSAAAMRQLAQRGVY